VAEVDESKASEYRDQVLALDHAGLVNMWEAIQSDQGVPDWPQGTALEYLILRAFQLEGAKVTWPFRVYPPKSRQQPGKVQLEQIDGAIYFSGYAFLVEAKDREDSIDFGAVAKLKAQLLRRPHSVFGAVFSISEFTDAALALADLLPPPNVLLWGGPEINLALRRQRLRAGMERKLQYAIEHGFPDLDLTEKEDWL
jgi:hypothetical protein